MLYTCTSINVIITSTKIVPTMHAMEIVLLGLSLLLQIASFHVLQGAKRKRSHDELRNEAHYIALKWSACICGQIGGKIILRCMQSVCVYEREN